MPGPTDPSFYPVAMILSWLVRSRRTSPCSFSAVHAFTIVLRYVALRLRGRQEFFVVRFLFCGCLVIPAFSKVTGTVLSCLQRLGRQAASSSRAPLASCIDWSMPLNTLWNVQTIPVSRLRACRFLQNLRDLLSTAGRTALFSICSCFPFAEVAHKNFCLVGELKDSSMSYPESRSTMCAERYSTNPLTLPGSSSFVLHCAEIVCKLDRPFSVLRCHQWEHINPMIRVEGCGHSFNGTTCGDISFSASCSSDGF